MIKMSSLSLVQNASVWNDSVWTFLFCMADNFPRYPNKKLSKVLQDFFIHLNFVLPCKQCQKYYHDFLFKIRPISTFIKESSPLVLLDYTIELRNYVMKHYDSSFRTKDDVFELLSKNCPSSKFSTKNPMVWGSSTWLFMHCISFSYPVRPTTKDKEMYCQFFQLLSALLPCPTCSQHMQSYLQSNPIKNHVASRTELTKYIIGIHNHVNRFYKKKSKLSLKKAKEMVKYNCNQKIIKNQKIKL